MVEAIPGKLFPAVVVLSCVGDNPLDQLDAELLVVGIQVVEVEVGLNRRLPLLHGLGVNGLVPPLLIVAVDMLLIVFTRHLNKVLMID